MDELKHYNIRVKQKYAELVKERSEKIRSLFPVRLSEVWHGDSNPSTFAYFKLEPDPIDHPIDASLISKVQSYVDSVCRSSGEEGSGGGTAGGEDSSYDSDYEGDEGGGRGGDQHRDVSRTASDTLAAEFAEYVSTGDGGSAAAAAVAVAAALHSAPGYTARLEFGLKLGYTEQHVQAALHKLGPNPSQNELLAELIKLGAQAQPLSSEGCYDWPEESDDLVVVEHQQSDDTQLRPIVIDGSNVAMSHGNKEVFSCRGIKICVDWFRARGHKEITVFVPKWRKEASRPDNPITDQDILYELERERLLVFTPSRLVGGKRLVCYDDRYILRLAAEIGGIVVSNDNYRDLAQESPKFRKVVEERILMYSFVNDRFMPPDDPLGRSGPLLEKFLRVSSHRGEPPPPCPYAKKCTYGNKCKFQHPERGALPQKTVTERLVEHAQRQLQARARDSSPGKQLKGKSLSLPLQSSEASETKQGVLTRKTPLSRTKSNVVGGGSSLEGELGDLCFRSPPPTLGFQMRGGQENSHKKLQRQLTLNPGCDPRLYQLRRCAAGGHQTVTRHVSVDTFLPPPPPPQHQVGHPSVTRIASAPPSAPPPPSHHHHRSLTSASDPNLPAAWPPLPHMPPPTTAEQVRCRLHYHLASIFPEEQVRAAMQLYPTETNPKKICAAILGLPPKP